MFRLRQFHTSFVPETLPTGRYGRVRGPRQAQLKRYEKARLAATMHSMTPVAFANLKARNQVPSDLLTAG